MEEEDFYLQFINNYMANQCSRNLRLISEMSPKESDKYFEAMLESATSFAKFSWNKICIKFNK